MKLERRQFYPVAPARLIEASLSRACYAARYGDAAFDLWQQEAGGLRIRMVKPVPVRAEKLPAILRPFVAPEMPLYLEFFWHGLQPGQVRHDASAELRLWLDKVPVTVEGRVVVSGQGEQSEQRLLLELVSRLPLLGRKLLEKVQPRVDALLEADHQAMLEYLASQP
jgi:hypothetical protein|nr:hypothetical protein MERC5_00014 [uncultured bacterium]